MQKENDTLLVAKLREGNKFAFEALYEKIQCQAVQHHRPSRI